MAASGSSEDLVPVWRIIPESAEGAGAVLVLRDGSFRLILKAGSVNFDMKSAVEQVGISGTYGQMLNSLTPEAGIQIFCHNKRLDSGAYLHQFDARAEHPNTPPAIREIIEDRRRHFAHQVLANNLLEREFYVVVPHNGSYPEIGSRLTDSVPGAAIFGALVGLGARKVTPQHPDMDEFEIDIALQQLDSKAANIEGYLSQIDVSADRLGADEIRKLFYELFHPGLAERQKLVVGQQAVVPSSRGLLREGDGVEQRRARPPREGPGGYSPQRRLA